MSAFGDHWIASVLNTPVAATVTGDAQVFADRAPVPSAAWVKLVPPVPAGSPPAPIRYYNGDLVAGIDIHVI